MENPGYTIIYTPDTILVQNPANETVVTISRENLGDASILINILPPEVFLGSEIVNITLLNRRGQEIQPEGDIEFCYREKHPTEYSKCLGYSNEGKDWSCEACLEKKGDFLCGNTDHFTMFSILLGAYGNKVDGFCDSAINFFITGSSLGDSILITLTVAFVCCLMLICVAAATVYPALHGEEHQRLRKVRSLQKSYADATEVVLLT